MHWIIDFVLLSAIWGSSWLLMRLATPEFGAMPTVFFRVAGAALILLPLVAWRGQLGEFRRVAPRVLFVGVLNSAIPFACIILAVTTISTGLAAVINAMTPMMGALVAWAWLGDKLNLSRSVGLAIGFLGVLWLTLQRGSFANPNGPISAELAVGLCVLAAVCYGIAASFTKKYLTGVPSLVTATGSQVGATLAMIVPAWLTCEQFHPTGPGAAAAWFYVAVLAVVCTALAYVMYFRIVERAGPARALAVTFLVPVFALFYGAVTLGERVTLPMLMASGVVILGTALAVGILKLPFTPSSKP